MATKTGIEHDDYLQQLFRGGLTTPSIALRVKCIFSKYFREGILKSWI